MREIYESVGLRREGVNSIERKRYDLPERRPNGHASRDTRIVSGVSGSRQNCAEKSNGTP